MFYGAVVWDPWLIVAQIITLQCLHYLTLGVFLSLLVGTRVSRMSLVYFFDFATISIATVTGWCVIASFLLSAIAGAFYMLYLIERAKKCLDFSATLFTIHLILCILYGGWPSSLTWWIVNGTGLAVMALFGEYLCIRRELLEIPITRYHRPRPVQVLIMAVVTVFLGLNTIILLQMFEEQEEENEEPRKDLVVSRQEILGTSCSKLQNEWIAEIDTTDAY